MRRGFPATPVYLLAAGLFLFPLLDAFPAMLPLRPGQTAWRFGAATIASRALLVSLGGLVLALTVAALHGHREVQRWVGFLAASGAVVLTGTLPVFTRDALVMLEQVQGEGRLPFMTTTGVTALKLTTFWLLGSLTGWAGFRWESAFRPLPSRPREDDLILAGEE